MASVAGISPVHFKTLYQYSHVETEGSCTVADPCHIGLYSAADLFTERILFLRVMLLF
jgi:hypothetical protein